MWIIGDSITRRAHEFLRESDRSVDLDCRQYTISWKGRGGRHVADLSRVIESETGKYPTPDVIIIACGSNDLVEMPKHQIIQTLKDVIAEIWSHAPDTHVIYSTILPRLKYKGALNQVAIDSKRKHINAKIMAFIGVDNTICHPQFSRESKDLIKGSPDWVHLTSTGCSLFVENIRNYLQPLP